MSGQVRQRMIQGATEILGRRGLHATAFSEVLALTGASRGSIYHHFPGGKSELVEAVVDDYSTRRDDALRALHGQSAVAVVEGALAVWRAELIRNDCESGCPIAAITIAADSSRLLERCGEAFQLWHDTIVAALQASGCAAPRAHSFATLLVASIQGAIVLARAEGGPASFDAVAEQMRAQAATLA